MAKSVAHRPCWIWRWTRRLSRASLILVLLGAPALYFGLPMLAKSPWARSRVQKALARTTGAPVSISGLEVSLTRGVTLRGVSCRNAVYGRAEVTASAKELLLQPDPRKLFSRKPRGEIVVIGPVVRIQERAEAGAASSFRPPRLGKRRLHVEALRVREGTVTFESELHDDILRVEDLTLDAAVVVGRDRAEVRISRVEARVNGGAVSGRGSLTLLGGAITAKLDVEARDVASGELLARALRYALPLFDVIPSGALEGRLDVVIRAEGAGKSWDGLIRAARGSGELTFREGSLSGCRMLAAAGQVLGEAHLAEVRFDEANARFLIHDGRIENTLSHARGREGQVRLMGQTSFDGLLDYQLFLEGLTRGEPRGVLVRGSLALPVVLVDPPRLGAPQ